MVLQDKQLIQPCDTIYKLALSRQFDKIHQFHQFDSKALKVI